MTVHAPDRASGKGSLRRRIVAAYVVLAVVVCASFAAAVVFALEAVEKHVIIEKLSTAADTLIARHRQGQSTEVPFGPNLLYGPKLPPAMGGLAPGIHELKLEGRSLEVLIRHEAGETYALVTDDTKFEDIQLLVFGVSMVAVIACVALAYLLGRATAHWVIAPLSSLAQAVAQDADDEALVSLNSADEIGVLARAFAERRHALRQFLERERWFTGDVSHELRTPLTIMLGAAELLIARLEDRPDLSAVAERIRRTAADTTERVSALMLLSRAPHSVDAPRTELLSIVQQEIDRCRPLLAGKPVALRLSAAGDVWVFARPELLAIAIGNLLRNACQFTEAGEVVVTVSAERVVVEDTGAGVAQALRERLFERYVRGDQQRVAGFGLGMAIVRRVAEHLGWDIRHEDRPGGGRQPLRARLQGRGLMCDHGRRRAADSVCTAVVHRANQNAPTPIAASTSLKWCTPR